MRTIWLITKRELGANVRSPLGFIVAAMMLMIDGLLFNSMSLGGQEKLSAEVLAQFIYLSSGALSIIASALISIRLFAEEQQTGTIALLLTSPIKDWHMVLGKFFGALLFLMILLLISIYMPLLIMIHGKISWGHLVVGYCGLVFLASACLAIGTFGSALVKNQILAIFVTAFLLAILVLIFNVAKISESPLDGIFSYLALHNVHFRPFMKGELHLKDVVFYLSVTVFFLFLAVRMLESRRWR